MLQECDLAVRETLAAYVEEHADAPRERILAVFDHLRALGDAAGLPAERADQLAVLASGAMATAGINASRAREVARTLLAAG
ncbi:hypothetical protein E1265_02750 [Streptomyces sp. 8K308]|uniref:hypothetical protein n=1 Tax=Streptomyces sp. 8K308 TaxID=2530388 RepID=UPI001050F30F|nr:hypothetical protein [Streptomyces sp. 8K308]TDC27047.1 hypothetical protein E1265_02750 [Streptomyces sp. 8K308]